MTAPTPEELEASIAKLRQHDAEQERRIENDALTGEAKNRLRRRRARSRARAKARRR